MCRQNGPAPYLMTNALMSHSDRSMHCCFKSNRERDFGRTHSCLRACNFSLSLPRPPPPPPQKKKKKKKNSSELDDSHKLHILIKNVEFHRKATSLQVCETIMQKGKKAKKHSVLIHITLKKMVLPLVFQTYHSLKKICKNQ